MSILKYRSENPGLNFNRADIDGAPFRGNVNDMPLMRDEEFEQNTVRKRDVHVRTFKLWEPKDAEKYEEVLDKCANEWWTLVRDVERYVESKENFLVFCVWVEHYVQPGAPAWDSQMR